MKNLGWLTSLDSSLVSHGLVFVGGLASGFSPCTLPTVALIVAYVGSYGKGRIRAFWVSAAFVLGLALTLATAGFFTALAGGLLRDSPAMTYIAAGLCLVMGLVLLNLVPLSLPGTTLSGHGRRGVLGAFLLGIPFAFVASPCTTPVTLAVLAFAASAGAPVWGATLLFSYAVGRSVPLLMAGVLAGTASSLTVSETWSARLRQASGVILLAVGLYLLWQVL